MVGRRAFAPQGRSGGHRGLEDPGDLRDQEGLGELPRVTPTPELKGLGRRRPVETKDEAQVLTLDAVPIPIPDEGHVAGVIRVPDTPERS